jgi:cold-inducible RNA-binding protein
MKNIYVGNLDYSTSEQDLRGLFEPYGPVENVSLAKDKFSGQSRGFGFVEMTNDADGEKAISELNGRQLGNRNLTVNEARPREARPPRSGGFGGNRGGGGGGGRGGWSGAGTAFCFFLLACHDEQGLHCEALVVRTQPLCVVVLLHVHQFFRRRYYLNWHVVVAPIPEYH